MATKTKKQKCAEKRGKCAEKKAKVKAKRTKCGVLAALLAAAAMAGCQSPIERSDPASKSARTTYGAISIVCSGDSSYCTFTLGDGAFTAADGEGATTTTASNDAAAKATAQVPGSAVAAGINAAATVIGKGIDAYAATKSQDCNGGDCADGSCADGSCADGECTP